MKYRLAIVGKLLAGKIKEQKINKDKYADKEIL